MAAFSFSEFYQRNRRVVIWVILFLLLWLLRDFFTVVFLTFVLAIVAAPLAEVGMRRLRLPHWAAVTIVYVIFLVVVFSFVRGSVHSLLPSASPTKLATVLGASWSNRRIVKFPSVVSNSA